jgi:hypothetical protein
MENLQYPVGRFEPQPEYTSSQIQAMLGRLQRAPARYEALVTSLSEAELTKTYRPDSWNVRQLVHHVADLHLLNFLRFKKALTEPDYEATLIKMNDWAITPDAAEAPVAPSLLLFNGVNQRLIFLLKSLDEPTLTKTIYHSARQIHLSLKQLLYMATWHVAHHQAHIELALGLEPEGFRVDS